MREKNYGYVGDGGGGGRGGSRRREKLLFSNYLFLISQITFCKNQETVLTQTKEIKRN